MDTSAEARRASSLPGVMTLEELAAYSHDQLELHPNHYTPQLYVHQFRRRLEGRSVFFNGWALACGGLWFLYRKFYALGATVLLVEGVLMPLVLGAVLLHSSAWTFVGVSVGVSLMLRLGLALVASPLYFSAAQKAVERARREAPTERELLQRLSARGGTNQFIVIAVIVVFCLLPIALANILGRER